MNQNDYNIKRETLEKWLLQIFEISGADTLENAINFAKMLASNEEEVEISNTIAVLYRAECSGDIDPPIEMRKLYAEVVAENSKKEIAC